VELYPSKPLFVSVGASKLHAKPGALHRIGNPPKLAVPQQLKMP